MTTVRYWVAMIAVSVSTSSAAGIKTDEGRDLTAAELMQTIGRVYPSDCCDSLFSNTTLCAASASYGGEACVSALPSTAPPACTIHVVFTGQAFNECSKGSPAYYTCIWLSSQYVCTQSWPSLVVAPGFPLTACIPSLTANPNGCTGGAAAATCYVCMPTGVPINTYVNDMDCPNQ